MLYALSSGVDMVSSPACRRPLQRCGACPRPGDMHMHLCVLLQCETYRTGLAPVPTLDSPAAAFSCSANHNRHRHASLLLLAMPSILKHSSIRHLTHRHHQSILFSSPTSRSIIAASVQISIHHRHGRPARAYAASRNLRLSKVYRHASQLKPLPSAPHRD